MTLRRSEKHREKLPSVQRHNYCEYGRNNDPRNPTDPNLQFCFCNDWNGCNSAPPSVVRPLAIAATTLLALSVASLLAH
jgi:hypothetical protein